jgi:hypothetical protein
VLLQGASNLAVGDYDLALPKIKWPGIANILGLVIRFMAVTLFIISKVWE